MEKMLQFPTVEDLWDWLLQEKAYEFIDFYCYGIAHQYLKKAGFFTAFTRGWQYYSELF